MMGSERKIIGIFGKVNSGKSSLFNSLTKTEASIVSSEEGTTTDPVKVYFELKGIGKTVIYDTAGLGDKTKLGAIREKKTFEVLDKCDVLIYVIDLTNGKEEDSEDIIDERFKSRTKKLNKKVIYLARLDEDSHEDLDFPAFIYKGEEDNERLLKELARLLSSGEKRDLLGGLVKEKDRVVLVVPIDEASPEGRIILPQQMVIRSLLDKKALISICGPDELLDLKASLDRIDLVITDSQVFKEVSKKLDPDTKLLSFSILFAAYKGDIDYFVESFYKLEDAKDICIYEGCFHHPGDDDIARVKIPNLIREKYGEKTFTFTRDREDIKNADLAIICGSCTKARSEVEDLINFAKENGVYLTNFGVTLAGLTDILERITFPKKI